MWDIDITTFAAAVAEGQPVLDVREPQEYAAGHLAGSHHIPMGRLPQRIDELDRARPVYVICRSGNRSSAMVQVLRHQGFDAWNVDGGLVAWEKNGHPVERPAHEEQQEAQR